MSRMISEGSLKKFKGSVYRYFILVIKLHLSENLYITSSRSSKKLQARIS